MTPVRLRITQVFSAVMALIGVVLIVETAIIGGGAGYIVGALFLLAGLGRLYMSSR